MKNDKKYTDFTKMFLCFAKYICNILGMIIIKNMYSVMEVELTMNKVNFPLITRHGTDTQAIPLNFNISV
jgi:hypothetical protein